MKKTFLFIGILLIPFLLSGCTNNIKSNNDTNLNIAATKDSYIGSYYEGNYIWGGAMNLAWNDLNDNILHEKLELNTTNKVALNIANKFNSPVFTKNDLDEKSYYIKSGFGQKMVDTINKESRAKFPTKSFADLTLKLNSKDIISYAYFLKSIEYKNKFAENTSYFKNESVSGFSAFNGEQKDNINVVGYDNDNKFIISLNLKDNTDQIFLVKGFGIEKIDTIMNEINSNKNISKLSSIDNFWAPKLKLDYHREYTELVGQGLKNKDFQDYYISQMFENIKFNMDEEGAKVENEGVIGVNSLSILNDEKEVPKNFILDKSYMIIMKRADSKKSIFYIRNKQYRVNGERIKI